MQSIEDAWVLARCLPLDAQKNPANPANPATALLKYENLRKDRAQRLQLPSRNAERWYHPEDPDEIARRNARLAAHAQNSASASASGGGGLGGLTPQQNWLFAYDAEKADLGTDHDGRTFGEWYTRSHWNSDIRC